MNIDIMSLWKIKIKNSMQYMSSQSITGAIYLYVWRGRERLTREIERERERERESKGRNCERKGDCTCQRTNQ